MLVSKNDPNACARLDNFFRIAVGRGNARVIEDVAEDMVRLHNEGIETPTLRVRHGHPMAPFAQKTFEAWGIPERCVLIA